jgi:hypothetical protein
MEAAAARQWFLRKHDDGAIFGPLPFEQLARWASSAQIAPRDSVSADAESWMKAPMLPELGMDWIVEVTSESLYGPTTLGAIREFMRLGEINEETFVINSCDATRHQVRDLAPLFEAAGAGGGPVSSAQPESGPGSAGISIAAHQRIRELEQALHEERRARAGAEERYRELERKHNQLLDLSAASRT